MIFYTVALPAEARPFIEKLSMKRLPDENRYQIYAGDGCYLIITGVGGINAMAAATYLLTRFLAQKTDLLINAGICAVYLAGNETLGQKGRIFVARSIYNSAFGRSSYPDMIYKTPFNEADVITVPDVYHEDKGSPGKQDFQVRTGSASDCHIIPLLVEMEAAFIYEAAIRFIYSHNMIILKIVSDDGEPGNITKRTVYDLVDTNIIEILDFINKIKIFNESKAGDETSVAIPEYEQALIDKIIKDLRLTKYQQNEIRKLARFYVLRGKPLRKILEEARYTVSVETKKEGKVFYGRLRSQLITP